MCVIQTSTEKALAERNLLSQKYLENKKNCVTLERFVINLFNYYSCIMNTLYKPLYCCITVARFSNKNSETKLKI